MASMHDFARKGPRQSLYVYTEITVGHHVQSFYVLFFSDQLKGHLMKSKSSSPDFGQSH